MGAPPEPVVVEELIGVYDAVGTLRGEVAYWVGARLGRTHCALCEVTHGRFTERAEWRAARDALPVAFTTFHRDDQPAGARACTGDRAPVVLARTPLGLQVLLGPTELEACGGSPDRLVELLQLAMTEAGLVWPVVS